MCLTPSLIIIFLYDIKIQWSINNNSMDNYYDLPQLNNSLLKLCSSYHITLSVDGGQIHLITGFVTKLTRRVPLVEQELPILRSTRVLPQFLVGFELLDLQLYMHVLQIVVCPFVLFHLAIVLFVLLRYMDYNCPFGIFKLFFQYVYSGR